MFIGTEKTFPQFKLCSNYASVVKVNIIEYLLIAMDKSEMDRIMSINGSER